MVLHFPGADVILCSYRCTVVYGGLVDKTFFSVLSGYKLRRLSAFSRLWFLLLHNHNSGLHLSQIGSYCEKIRCAPKAAMLVVQL